MKYAVLALMCPGSLFAADGFIYEEENVPPYELPALLASVKGEKITTPEQWAARRAEWRDLIEREMFGKAPARPKLRFTVIEEATPAFDGKAVRKQVRVFFSDKDDPSLDLLLYLPATAKPAPVIFGLNFMGNQSVANDQQIKMCRSWVDNKAFKKPDVHEALEESRGMDAKKWSIDYALSRGYGVVTAYYGDIDPDFDDGWKNGVHALFPEIEKARDGSTWGSLAAWAWGMSCAMDYLEQESLVDPKRVALQGFSRLGKASLWAAANDPRFAVVISQNSGAGGAALNKRIYGETVGRLNDSFPHWFCDHFNRYSRREKDLPFDSHCLLALCAPRPLLITSATGDQWADPKGEFLAGKEASAAYQLFGFPGLEAKELPPPMQFVPGRIGYFLRTGPHDTTPDDWKVYCDFCDLHAGK